MRAPSTTWTDAGRTSVSSGGAEAIGALGAVEAPGFGQRLDDLLSEERIAGRALADALGESRHRWVGAKEVEEQLAARLRAKRQERQLEVVRVLHPAGVVLGAEGDQEERACAGHRVDQRLDERRAACVDPVEILPQQQRRLAAAAGLADLLREREEPSLPRLGSHAQRGIRGIGDTEEVEEQRQVVG